MRTIFDRQGKKLFLLTAFIAITFFYCDTKAQMRSIYLDPIEGNDIRKFSFYSASDGYVAFRDWIGYTTDTGRTFVKKYVTASNVDYGTYNVNWVLGFAILGVKAFNQNNIIAYGYYGLEPSILYSNNGGNSFTLVYHPNNRLSFGVTDMIFPENNNIGYALDADQIIKTTNGGLSWTVIRTDAGFNFTGLEAADNNNVIAFSITSNAVKLIKTSNAGNTWGQVVLPAGTRLISAFFRAANTGWITSVDINNSERAFVYKTTNGGGGWTLLNNPDASPFASNKIKFTDDNTGYGVDDLFTIYKTMDGGVIWEPLPRDNNFEYFSYTHNDLHFWNANQFWAGGAHGFTELTTNAGGTPLPKAYFRIDTVGVAATGIVNLFNYSKTGYTYKWYKNDTLISTSYNASYSHYLFSTYDSVKLVVSNGTSTDSLTKYQAFYPPLLIYSFTPVAAATGNTVTITGVNFTGANAVSFGGLAATSFSVVSSTTITAVVGAGASGVVKVTRPTASGSLAGFTFIPPPTITSFSPLAAAAGTTVTITGTNFINVSAVTFGGINAASFTIVSPTTITAVVPSGPSGNIIVTTPGGTASLGGYSTIPTVASFTPLQGTHGTIMAITGTSFSGATAVSIGGIPALSFTVTSGTTITAVVGAGASGAVVVTKPAGNSSLAGFIWYPPPVITSFTPESGAIGTAVTITGTGFDPLPANNIVYFGSVKATVTGASSTSLQVTVPAGATFDPVSVVSNKLIGYSVKPFLVTFANGGSITLNSFTTGAVITPGSSRTPINMTTGDFDGDGKTDIAVTCLIPPASSGVLIYRNTSTLTTVSFASPVVIITLGYRAIAAGDLDGDGKLDIAIANENSTIGIFRNTSVPGTISFVSSPALSPGGLSNDIIIGDVDGDGKADILDATATIYRNVSEPGAIAFAPKVTYGLSGTTILLNDIDGDQKPEMIISNTTGNAFSVFKNNCTPTNISFAPNQNFQGYSFSWISSGDIDGDNKTDIVLTNTPGSSVVVSRNISSVGTIAFDPPVPYTTIPSPTGVSVSDLDGDGKADIAVGMYGFSMSVYKNLSASGNISLGAAINYLPADYGVDPLVTIADINGDGKNDGITLSDALATITIHLNNVKADPFISFFTPTVGESGTVVTITGTNFTGTTAVSIGGVAAASFVVNSNTSITAVVGAGATGDVQVTNSLGTHSLGKFVFGIPPSITSFSPASGPVSTTVTITGTRFGATVADNIVYFGGMRTTVLTASTTSLTVLVPFGSLYDPIKVTTGGLTASSRLPFVTTFPGASNFTNSSFAAKLHWSDGGGNGTVSDIDGDTKPDLIFSQATNKVAVVLNKSIAGNISFAPAAGFTVAASPGISVAGDIDGDGKPDIAVLCGNSTFSVIRNTSSPGIVGFAPGIDVFIGNGPPNPSHITMSDADVDGKNDIIVSNYSASTVSVFKSTSTPGNISFDTRIDFSLPQYGTGVFFSDLDGDKKPDMIATSTSPSSFTIFRNTSLPGTITFALPVNFGASSGKITIGDVDNDGKPDIIFAGNGKLSIFRNISVSGAISFAPQVDYTIGSGSFSVATNDLDGDGKIDAMITYSDLSKVAVFKNNSTAGTIAFSAATDYESYGNPLYSTAADIDGDSKADIVSYSLGGNRSILRNQTGGNGPSIISFLPTAGTAGNTIIITGTNFTAASAVSFGGTAVASFSVISSDTISAVLSSGATGNVEVKSPAGIVSATGFRYSVLPVISNITPSLAVPGTTVVITGGNFTGITAVSFGGTAASSFTVLSPGVINAIVGDGSMGDVTVTSPAGTGSYNGFTFQPVPTITTFTPGTGFSGSGVTINGSGFVNVLAVSFGGVAATTFNVVSPTQITATLGNGASGAVIVTTPGGVATKAGFYYQSTPSVTSFFPVTGIAGTEVTVTGTNLGFLTDVKFGGTSASSFTITSATTVVATVGAGSSGSVSISNAWGTASLAGFTYASANAPAIISATPMIAGQATTVTITGVNFTGTTAVSFGGSVAASFTIVSPTTITAVVGSGASGNISVTNPSGTVTLPGFVYTTAPVITSFSPLSARPGAAVTLIGCNFSTTESSNIVYFGGMRATVTSATATLLTVTVPNGATYGPLTVTSSGLTGYSAKSFLPTFAGTGFVSPNAFYVKTDSVSFGSPAGLSLTDIDKDGKPDLTIGNTGTTVAQRNLTIYRNLSSPTATILAPRVVYANNFSPQRICTVDLDGDGTLDIVTGNISMGNALTIYPNNSTAGSISLGTPQQLTGNLDDFRAYAADFDGDGKPDIARIGGNLGVFRNTSSGSTISFAAAVVFAAIAESHSSAVEDFDGDGKTDILITRPGYPLLFFRNTCTPGNISFVSTSFNAYRASTSIISGDIDGDGKPDIAMVNEGALNNQPGGVSVLRNISIPGYFILEEAKLFSGGDYPMNIALADIDGNGKPDIIVSSRSKNTMSILSNRSAAGAISFDKNVSFPISGTETSVASADIDKDGRPDIIVTNGTTNSVSIFKNMQTGILINDIAVCAGANTSLTSGFTGASYQWQQNAGTGFADISNGINYSGATTATLQLLNVPATWNNREYRCIVNGSMISVQSKLTVSAATAPTITISGITTVTQGQSVMLSTAITSGGTNPAYQWQDSTNVHTWQNISGATVSTLNYSPALTGDKVRCKLTSNTGCGGPATVTSNGLSFVVTTVTAVNPQPAASYGMRLYPNPVSSSFTIDTLKLSDGWQSIEIVSIDGRHKLLSKSILNQTRVSVNVSKLPGGLYYAILRKRTGITAYLKFVKQ